MREFVGSRPVLWLILALPGLWIGWRWAATPEAYGYGHALADSGDWAAWLLLATLAVTPVRLAFRKRGWAIWMMRRRRDLGVASFAYGAGHTAIYLANRPGLAEIVAEAGEAELLTGWLAFALFVPLAVTSNDAALRALKRNWKRLHRLVYPAAVLVFAHWVLTAFDPTAAWFHLGILAAIGLVRLALRYGQRVT